MDEYFTENILQIIKKINLTDSEIFEEVCDDFVKMIMRNDKKIFERHRIIQNKKLSLKTLDAIWKDTGNKWVWYNISDNVNLTSDYIEKHPELDWEEIERHYDGPLERYHKSKKRTDNITVEKNEYNWVLMMIDIQPEKVLDLSSTQLNRNIPFEFVEKYRENPWDWYIISSNSDVTIDILKKHPDIPWDWSGMSCNPNLTIEFIERHLDKKWNWYEILRNESILDNEYKMRRNILRYIM